MSLFSAFRKSRTSHKRRSRVLNTTPGEVLEVRRLLTNAAPTLANIVAEDGQVTADVVDDGSGGQISVEVDYNSDGTPEEYLFVEEGEVLSIDVSTEIGPNQTQPITITVVEVPLDGSAALETVHVIDAEGLSIAEVNIDSLEVEPGRVLGTISSVVDGAIGELAVLYRQVGTIDWELFAPASVGGAFAGDVPAADGQRDFEFVVANDHYGYTVLGAIVTAYDVPGTGSGSGSEGLLDEDEDGLFSGELI